MRLNTSLIKPGSALFSLFALSFATQAFGQVPADHYVSVYNAARGLISRDHGSAKLAVQAEFAKVMQESYGGDADEFCQKTLRALKNRLRTRDQRYTFSKVASGSSFVQSSTSSVLEALNEFCEAGREEMPVFDSSDILFGVGPKMPPQAKVLPSTSRSGIAHADQPGAVADVVNGVLAESTLIRDTVETAQTNGSTLSGSLVHSGTRVALIIATGLALNWYGPAYLMVGTAQLFPIVYTHLFGAIPTGFAYYTVYLPALMNAQGMAYVHSSAILTSLFAVASAGIWIGYDVCRIAAYGTYYTARGFYGALKYAGAGVASGMSSLGQGAYALTRRSASDPVLSSRDVFPQVQAATALSDEACEAFHWIQAGRDPLTGSSF